MLVEFVIGQPPAAARLGARGVVVRGPTAEYGEWEKGRNTPKVGKEFGRRVERFTDHRSEEEGKTEALRES